MEIHSSSLAFIPAGFNGKNENDQPQTSNNRKENTTEISTVSSSQKIRTVDEKNNLSKLQLISDDIEQQKKTPSNSRTANAVNAYIQESSQSLKSQRADLISGIDLFV